MQALRNPLLLLLCALFFLGQTATGQTISKIEYFIDTDPGFGKGSAIAVTPDTDITASFPLDVTALSPGFHSLYVRSFMPPYTAIENGKTVTKGGWSFTQARSFYKQAVSLSAGTALSPVVAGEYFVDADPGYGKGKTLTVSPGLDVTNVSFVFDITTLAKGFHQLSLRFKDASGTWSAVPTRSFYKEVLTREAPGQWANITYGEYFFDQDPGPGKGISISLTPGQDLAPAFTADVTALTRGFHQLFVRFKNADGVWSATPGRSFYKETISTANMPLAKINRLEYFVDTDPGFGNGTSLSVTPALSLENFDFLMDMSNISIGNHKVYVRAQDENGVWSMVSTGDFKIKPPTDLIITLGTISNTVCAGSTVSIPFTVNAPFGSNNVFTVQLSDASGKFANPVNIGSLTQNGSGSMEATIPAATSAGTNYRIRIIGSSPSDTSGNSDPITIKRVPEAYLAISGNTKVCLGSTAYAASPVDPNATTYTWSLPDGGTLDATTGTAVTVNWTKAGSYPLKMTASNACGSGTEKRADITVFEAPPAAVPVITASGKSLTVANPPAAGIITRYKWYRNGSLVANLTAYSVTPAEDGSYTVRFVNSCGEGPESSAVDYWVNKQGQTISVEPVADPTYGQETYVVIAATTTSGLPLTYSLQQGSGRFQSDTLYFGSTGNYSVKVSQPGNNVYAPASVTISFTVKKAEAQITFSNLTTVYTGSAQKPSVTTTPAGLAVNLTYNGESTVPVNAGSYAVVATITNSNYQGVGNATFTIQKAAQTISLPAIPDLPLTSPTYKLGASASSGLPVTILLSTEPAGIAAISEGTLHLNGLGTGTVEVTQAGDNNYLPATAVTLPFKVTKGAQVINFPPIADQPWGSAPLELSATATSGLTVAYRIVSGPAMLNGNTVTLTGRGTVVIEATQPGNALFSAAMPVQRSFAVVAYPDLFVQNVAADKTDIGPGENVTVSWKVGNKGTGAALVKWTERLYLQAPDGTNKTLLLLHNFTDATPLATGQVLNRSTTVMLPALLNIGDAAYFVVELVPDAAVQEQAADLANNTAVQEAATNIKKLLRLELSASQLGEGASAGVTGTISRSGTLAGALMVNLSAEPSQRFIMPATVTIPAGQAGTTFTITAPDNSIVEGNLPGNIAATATGFAPAAAPLLLLDNDKATLSFSNIPAQANEGDVVNVTVHTSLAPAAPLTVYLTASSKKFPVPAAVTIAAGSTSATVSVTIAQNTAPEIDQTLEIKAGAANHQPAVAAMTIKDDDLPNLELVLQTTTVSEGAGLYATQATLRRTSTGHPVAFTANLTASLSNTLLLPASISLGANENEKTFSIGVVDNTQAEGQRQVTITAAVFVNSCGCSAPPATSGSVTAHLTINDNDGPALTLTATPLTLPEGMASAGMLRISRNTSTAAALTVSLSSSNIAEATVPATATIPAGKTFVEVPITTVNDGVTDGAQTVYFQATAKDFSAGSVWIMVTDQNKPDLQVPSVKLGSTAVQATNLFSYNLTVQNSGFATAPAGVVVHGYLSKDDVLDATDTLLTVDTLAVAIPAGQSVPVLNAVRAPNRPGMYKLLFKVNPESTLSELLLTNNAAPATALTILPDYTATAVVQPEYFQQGDTVSIRGTASKPNGTPAAEVPVEVYVITQGLRRTVTAITNSGGQYGAAFVPLAKEAGHYTVGASFPGMGLTAEQDAFDILGVRINNGTVPQFKIMQGQPLTGSLTVENLSSQALTNLTLQPVSLPNGAVMQFTPVARLAANGSAPIEYTLTGNVLSPGSNFSVAQLQAVSQEGLKQGFDVLYYCQAPNAYVVSNVPRLDVAVSSTVGERTVSFTLVNKGQGSTGAITLNLPKAAWLTSVTPKTLPPLASGDTALVVLKFAATADLPFNVPVNSSIGIQVQNGNTLTLPFSFEKKAESKGTLVVSVSNQFTFYSEGAPKVQGARVQIKNYFTGAVYAQGLTGEDGVFSASGLPEGKHRIVVEKQKHEPADGTVEIKPGGTTQTSVFLNYKAIEYSWSVLPTAVQDQYDITLNAQFETHVPMPVVTIEMPKKMPQLSGSETYAFNVTLTNHGLITAKDVTLGLPKSDPEYEFVTNYIPADLLAQQSIQVPVIMRRRTQAISGSSRSGISVEAISRELGIAAPAALGMANNNLKCSDYADVQYWYTCSLSTGLWEKGGVLFSYSGRACLGGGITEAIIEYDPKPYTDPQTRDPKCAICPVIPVGNGNGPTFEFKEEKKSCLDCILDMLSAAADCLGIGPDNVKFSGSVGGKIQRVRDLYDQAKNYYGHAQTAICVIKAAANGDVGGALKCIPLPDPPGLPCAKAIGEAALTCMNTGVGGGGGATGGAMLQKSLLKTSSAALGANIQAKGAAKALADAGSAGAEVFRTIANNFSLAVKAFEFRTRWAQEYFGDMAYSDAFGELATRIAPYVTTLDSIRPAAQAAILQALEGYEIQPTTIQAFFTRWNTSLAARQEGVLEPNATYPSIINWKEVTAYADSIAVASEKAMSLGYASIGDLYMATFDGVKEILEGQSNQAACASVTVQFSQKLTMTREAFEGTLNIFNGHPTDKMESLSVNLQITDEDGVPANGLFEIQTKSLTNLSDVTGTGEIAGQGTGTVKFLFIPEPGAAPTVAKKYTFGGNIRYFDPYQKQMVTMPLSDVVLTVNPSPNLMLHYFMQRNILGDDALTTPAIEPSEPAELAVMVENQGYGPAVNMTISSAQPKIVDNEKGLAVNFNLIGSNFQGQPRKLGVTDINFGTVPGRETRIGQWYFTSSLLGKFVSYEASVVHANSFGNPELSLVKGVKLHELTKSIRAYAAGEDDINDFLANDIFDVDDVPDVIYFSQGMRTEKVAPATSGSFNKSVGGPTFTNMLTVTPSEGGWNYIRLADPGNGRYELVSVTRNSDGQAIPLDNAWLTFVTLPASRPPVYENKFHFVDAFAATTPVSYTVVWKPKNRNVPKIVRIEGAPETTTTEQVKKLTVVFDKAIDASTFTPEDLTLTLQGSQNIINNSVVITALDTASFEVDLSGLTAANGFFAFTAQAAGVKDSYGISGTVGKQVTWTQFLNVPAVQAFTGLPAANRAAAFDTLGVLFNLPIDESTVTPQSFLITKDGVAQSGSVTIDSVRADKKLFYLSGLGAILSQSGEYRLTVDLPNIRSTTGVAGTAQQSVLLVLDNEGPLLVSMDKAANGGLNAQHIAFVNLQFNEDVAGLNTSALKLTRNGQVLPVTYDMLQMLNNKDWQAGNFGMLTYPEGDYTLTLEMSSVKDALGNSGTGTQSLSWTVNRAALITLTNLSVSPDLGFSATDGITASDSLMVRFDLSHPATQISIAQVDLSGEQVYTTLSNQPAGAVSIPLTGLNSGNASLRITATGENGSTTTANLALYIDKVPLTGQWQLAPGQTLAQQPSAVPLQLSAKLLSNADLSEAVQLKRNGVALPTTTLRFEPISETEYRLTGLEAAGNTPGTYTLLLNLAALQKYSSGMSGNGTAQVSWNVLSQNRAPVAHAGDDVQVNRPGTVTLNATASSDPDGNSLMYSWVAPEGITLTDATSATPSFTLTADASGKTFTFLLIVSDGEQFATANVNVRYVSCPPMVYYRDADGDGFGDAAQSQPGTACAPPTGYVTQPGDCNDNNAAVYPGAGGCGACANDAAIFYAGSGTAFQWQVNDGTGYKIIADGAEYAGTTTAYLQLTKAPTAWAGYTFRCLITAGGTQSPSAEQVLRFTFTWKGTVSSEWENPQNWSCNKVPDEYTDVIVAAGVPLVLKSAATVRSLTLDTSAQLTIQKGASLDVKK